MAEITVYNFEELKNAITDTASTVIHLGGNIIFTSSGGINVPKTKGDIVIDGGGFTVTDWNSGGYADTIHIQGTTGSAITITLQNTVWNGRNYFGVIHPYESSSNSNITVALNNVQYTGPQAIHNRYGITRVVDSTFDIALNGATYISAAQEFVEINRISIGGNVTVNSQTASDSVIWFTYNNTTLTVEENAVFTVRTPSSYMFYADVSTPVMTFNQNSATEISTARGLYNSTSSTIHIASSFTIKNSASFKATQSARTGVPSFKCRNSFVMEEGSTFHLIAPTSGTASLMYFGTTAAISFNNPKSVILYDNGGNVFQFAAGNTTSPNRIDIEAELINRWTTAKTPFSNAGGFDDTPTRAFAKVDGSNITAAINTTTSAITLLNSNIQADDIGYPMNTSTFNIFQTQVLSMGNLNIDLNEICDDATAITGMTESSANLKAMYDDLTLTSTAEPEGDINLSVPAKISAGTAVYFAVNWNFLTKQVIVTINGSVRITYLPDLAFNCFAVPFRKSIVKRKDTDWYLEITDTRTDGEDWYLYAVLPDPMRSGSNTLDDALTFNEGTSSEIMSDLPILIRQESWSESGAVTRITWSELEGFLLKIIPDFLYDEGHYTATITWELRDTPR